MYVHTYRIHKAVNAEAHVASDRSSRTRCPESASIGRMKHGVGLDSMGEHLD